MKKRLLFFYLLDDLRIRGNKSLYYGEQFEKMYLNNNEYKIKIAIKKIEKLLVRY